MGRFAHTAQPDWDWWSRLWPTPGATLRTLGIGPADRVVDLGCGNGYFTLPAARITASAPVYAVDIDRPLLDAVAERATQQDIGNIHPIRADLSSVSSILPRAVDVAVLANTCHGIAEPGSVLEAVAGCLASEGRLILINWRDTPRAETTIDGVARGPPTEIRVGPAEMAATVTAATPCVLQETIPLAPYHYAQVYHRSSS
jgi:SAM-dependent methyltransferase